MLRPGLTHPLHFLFLTYDQYLQTDGTGVNFKAGVIYRPVPGDDWCGHPYTYFLRKHERPLEQHNDFRLQRQHAMEFECIFTLGEYDYQMSTPFRAIGSIAFTIGNIGLISGEYEYVNYNQARFYSPIPPLLIVAPAASPSADARYATAMQQLSQAYPKDDEAQLFYALALLGKSEGVRDVPTYLQAGAIAKAVFMRNPDHPGAAHYWIHAMDDPQHAAGALGDARALSKIAPSAAHV